VDGDRVGSVVVLGVVARRRGGGRRGGAGEGGQVGEGFGDQMDEGLEGEGFRAGAANDTREREREDRQRGRTFTL
jgi:hypothetical protein